METIGDSIDMFIGINQFLSNFAGSPIIIWDKTFSTVEHAYQFAKTLDPKWQDEILNASTPGKAKRIGQKCPIRDNWENIKNEVMLQLLQIKFSNPWFQNQLLLTGDKYLVEGNTWHDNYWGNCTCDICSKNHGQNILGKLLMAIREELKNPIKNK